MTDAEYWSIANSLPKRSDGTVWKVDWRTRIPNCGDGSLQSCEWVLGFNPLSGCWIDPGAQYVARPSPYPSPSSWGVSLCNAPITQPPASGGGTTAPPSSGGGSGGNYVPTQPPIVSSSAGFQFSDIPTWAYFAVAGFAIFMFMKN